MTRTVAARTELTAEDVEEMQRAGEWRQLRQIFIAELGRSLVAHTLNFTFNFMQSTIFNRQSRVIDVTPER